MHLLKATKVEWLKCQALTRVCKEAFDHSCTHIHREPYQDFSLISWAEGSGHITPFFQLPMFCLRREIEFQPQVIEDFKITGSVFWFLWPDREYKFFSHFVWKLFPDELEPFGHPPSFWVFLYLKTDVTNLSCSNARKKIGHSLTDYTH